MSVSSFPMIERCMLAQWRGLSQEERDTMTHLWQCGGNHAYGNFLRESGPHDNSIPIWDVIYKYHSIRLMELKPT